MIKDYPFYSRVRGIGAVDAYHTHPACQIAKSIESGYRLSGVPYGWMECTCCVAHWEAVTTHISTLEDGPSNLALGQDLDDLPRIA